jgi:hypothetical protein
LALVSAGVAPEFQQMFTSFLETKFSGAVLLLKLSFAIFLMTLFQISSSSKGTALLWTSQFFQIKSKACIGWTHVRDSASLV